MWRALSNVEEFGSWFGAELAGQAFAPGQRARGQMTYPGYEHIYFDVLVERVEPQDVLSFRWHPGAIDASVDYSREESTLVTFTLADAPEQGTLLKVVEFGFDKLPPERRLEAFRMNSGGGDAQMKNIVRHVRA